MVDFGANRAVLLHPEQGFAELLDPPAHSAEGGDVVAAPANDDAEGSEAEGRQIELAPVRAAASRIQSLLELTSPSPVPAAEVPSPGTAAPVQGPLRSKEYPLRTDIEFPRKLAREVMPKTMDGLVTCMAQRIEIDAATSSLP